MTKHCCDALSYHVNYRCDVHADRYECPDCVLRFLEGTGEYGIIIHDGGVSAITIQFCPFCGHDLSKSAQEPLEGINT